MSDSSTDSVSELLEAVTTGRRPSDELLAALYDELRNLARGMMVKVPPGNTLQPTALVHEAYLRLVANGDPGWDGRGHFFGSAARAMRHILVDQARRKAAVKHGGDRERLDVDENPIRIEAPDTNMLALDEALDQLERSDPRAAQVVHLRYFAGLSTDETADTMGLSVSTVEREWRYARTLLHFQLTEGVP